MKKNQGLATFVDGLLPKNKTTRIAWMCALAFSLLLALLPWIVKLDGHPHADWQQFLGRFHPLAVHLPIGLLVLVPLLEIAGASRPPSPIQQEKKKCRAMQRRLYLQERLCQTKFRQV